MQARLSAANRSEAPTRVAPGPDPEPVRLREGTRHRRPHGVWVYTRDMPRTGSSTDGVGARADY